MKYIIIIILLLLLISLIGLIIAIVEPYLLNIGYARLGKSSLPNNKISDFTNTSTVYQAVIPEGKTLNDSSLHLIFFSDLHAEYCKISTERLCSVIADANAKYRIDAVIFGGDLCNKSSSSDTGIQYLKTISNYCNELNIPFAGTTGNHDVELSKTKIDECGFIDLRERELRINEYIIAGVNDSGRKNRVWSKSPFTELECDSNSRRILVSHNPDWLIFSSEEDRENIDCMLSGHIHGGQCRLPFRIDTKVIRKDILPRKGVIKGVFDIFGVSLFISRGLGCVLFPLRFMARPEITIVEID